MLALLLATAAGADSLDARPDFRVRVLLSETRDPVALARGGGDPVRVEARRGSVVAGGRAVGEVWRVPPGGLELDSLPLRGTIEFRRTDKGLAVINEVPLEAYVAATLGRETYPSWHPATLRAQAVATRTYVLHRARRARGAWHVTADTRSQVYGGAAAESEPVVAATRETRGQWLAWEGEPILAVFHSSAGGRTASAEEVWGEPVPYLVSVAVDHEEDSPDTYWRKSVSRPTLGRALAPLGMGVGAVRELQVVERSPSGRARFVRVRGSGGEARMSARALREALGTDVIRSTLFQLRPGRDGGLLVVGSGHGHGVGMSQWGAEAMARGGADHGEILAAFYPGARLVGEVTP